MARETAEHQTNNHDRTIGVFPGRGAPSVHRSVRTLFVITLVSSRQMEKQINKRYPII